MSDDNRGRELEDSVSDVCLGLNSDIPTFLGNIIVIICHMFSLISISNSILKDKDQF